MTRQGLTNRSEYDKAYNIPIGSITSDQMMTHQDMILILNRQTSRLNITASEPVSGM